MAKTVKPIAVELEIKGGEKMAALNKSFRDLSKLVKFSDTDIRNAVKGIQDFADKAGNSEAVIKGQIKAFEGLREQAAMSGKAYRELSNDITELKAQLNGSTSAIDAQRKSLLETAGSAKATKSQLLSVANALSTLQKQTALGSKAFVELGQDIANLEGKISRVKAEQQELNNLNLAANQAAAGGAAATRLQIKAIDAKIASLREEKRTVEELSKRSKIRLGMQGFADRPEDVPFRTREYIQQAIAASLLGENITKMFGAKELETAIDLVKQSIAKLQTQVEVQLGRSARRVFQEMAREGRESARSLAIAFSGPEFERIFANLEQNVGGLPNTTAGLSQRLRELERVLNNTERSSAQYRRVSEEISKVQKELTKDVYSYSEALEQLAIQQEAAARRRRKLAGIEEYVAAVSGLGDVAAAERGARGGTPVVGQMRSREGFPQGYRDPETGAMIAPGYGSHRDRRAYEEAEELKRVAEAQKELEAAFDSAADSYRDALQTIQQYQEQRHNKFMSQIAEEDAAQQKTFAEQVAREEEAFRQELKRRDILLQAKKAAASALGVGGREDISSLYQGIIGLSTADIRRQQQMMGKSATEVLNDIATAFQKGGRAVDLKAKSTDIGDSIAEGISKGASDSDDINKGAKTFAERLIAAYKRVFAIKSPSKETEQKIGLPLGLGIIKGLLQGLREGRREVQQEVQSIVEDLIIPRSRQPRRLIGTVNQPIATSAAKSSIVNVARPATPGYRPLGSAPAEVSREIDQMFNRFRAGIAALTTDAEIYYNLLKRLPASRITTDLAALASRRADAMSPGFLETQRAIGPGDLEKEITAAVASYLKDVRTPNPWVGVVGDYKAFINAVSSQTKQLRASIPALPAGKVAGLLPPAFEGLTPAQQQRVAGAYARSEERSARISAEDARNRLGPAALPPGISGGALAAIGGGGAGGRGGARRGAAGDANGTFANLNKTLVDFGRLSDRSTADIRELGASLKGLQDILSPLDADFDAVNKAIERQSRLIDKELRKRERGRRRMSVGQFAQAAGATISGGIFGGPEGFLGGAIGTVFGGPQGAFAGAAIGAQVGQFRQQIGQYTEMAAEIDRLRLGLAGASNDFADFVQATQATESASQRLLIPLADSYRIMTQLRANTVELGLSVEDTRKIFEGITASVYKTGGGLNEVQGAMRAVIQVLSKGAPQAEELRGQLGERLPAAIIDFAKFTQRTPEELADAFQKSEVTLEEFVDFAKNKYDENGRYLDELATNAAYAGLRYEKALERLRLTTGRAFQAAGSNLQDFAARWINRIDAIINKALELGVIQKGPSFFVQKVLGGDMTIKELEAEVARLGLIAKQARESGASRGVKERTKQDADAAEQALITLKLIEKQTKERKKQLKIEQEKLDVENRGKSFLAAIEQRENAIAQARLQLEEQAAQIREQAAQRAKQIEEDIARQRLDKERQVQDLRRRLAQTQADIAFGREEAAAIAGGANPESFRIQREIIDIAKRKEEEKNILERQLLDEKTQVEKAIEDFKADTAKAILDANEKHTKRMGEIQRQYAAATAKIIEEGTGRAGKRLEIAAKLASSYIERANLNFQRVTQGLNAIPTPSSVDASGQPTYPGLGAEEVPGAFVKIDKEIAEASKGLSEIPTASALAAPAIDSVGVSFSDLTANVTAAANRLERVRSEIKKISADVSSAEGLKQLQGIFAGIAAPLGAVNRQLLGETQRQQGVLRLREEGFSASAAERIFGIEQQAAEQLSLLPGAKKTALEKGFKPADVDRMFVDTSENIRNAAEAAREFAISLENIPTEIKLRTSLVNMKEELRALVDPANQITGAANAIGSAFATSFTDLISGSSSAQEALKGFFESVAKYFLDMAAQIITKQLVMITLQTILKSLGGVPGGGGGGGGGGDIFDDIAARGGLRANGGPVAPNTTYLVGERGPELLTMGSQGGYVHSNQSAAMDRYRNGGYVHSNQSAAMDRYRNGGPAGTQTVNVNYSVTEINGMRFVTEDQFRAGMDQAARRGAKMGQTQTMSTLKNSRSQRSKIGL